MPRPPYRALRIILGIFSLLASTGGLLIIFSGKPLMMRLFLRPPESEVSTLLLFMMKEIGGFSLMLSLMLFFASVTQSATWPSSTRSLWASAYWPLHRCYLSIRSTSDDSIRAT